jgi:hypothetical protein
VQGVGNSFAKRDIDGSQCFYVDKDIDRIVTYCEKDTIAVAQIFFDCGEKIY